MYLSRVEIDDQNRQKVKDLTHLGAYHNWVENSFPIEIDQGKRLRHLWRIDRLHDKRFLLIVSSDKPNLDRLERYGVAGTAVTKNYQPFLEQIKNNEIMRFRLTANPTYRTNDKVYPHITVEQQKKWLLDRTNLAGFSIVKNGNGMLNFDIVNREWLVLYHHRRIRLSQVTFEGVLQVTDAEKINHTLIHGIGREKAYGMGMLTVIPIGIR
ncbi:type I-E CRISPR-associated protein Cas6/Cse3/CasE [Limosilactobacillus fastidiosus]|uniref:Type I-E CRISPR-associated protein Cas6/Cse3/CasE n=1 Tax=Limosilactobacillus fastidiosus TaxID=2759855 RepID=A0ABR6E6P2_9LACO|nr:type I-E CRISPR-associated protein Cas6/Cse3/CasE [Limosilactobacillus fastidiosus]MBB1062864.1 type I-E CRISPR-associated protein Cas6/Cse3/CasE [Limosilactobacillus fastidiosus]MCD7084088.1 type I-E CRISPR-associated protein Cas6/Cse3/CasE [Limosilactobacillus fastidiosus]